MTASQSAPSGELPAFESWWAEHGQFCRAGGGDYEKTFAFRAWEAALAARDAPAPAQWLPIETAPMDGTRIQAWIDWSDGPSAAIGEFRGGKFFPEFRKAACKLPTHWQPEPAAPAPLLMAAGSTQAKDDAL